MPANQSRLALTFILALVLALAASYLVYRQLSSATPVEARGQQVVIAAADLTIGTPVIDNAKVTATVVENYRGEKIVAFKKKRRKGYRKKIGHRQSLTKLKIETISA